MGRSTLTYNNCSLTGDTSTIRIAIGFLAKSFTESSSEINVEVSEFIEELRDQATHDYGFISIKLPNIEGNELNLILDIISLSIASVRKLGNNIPKEKLINLQEVGFFPPKTDMMFTNDMSTVDVIDYLSQLRKMLVIPYIYDLSKDENATSYRIWLEDKEKFFELPLPEDARPTK